MSSGFISALFIAMVSTTVFLFFISKAHWNDDPNFEALDCKFTNNINLSLMTPVFCCSIRNRNSVD